MKVMLLLLFSMVAPGCLRGAAPTPAGQAGQFWRVHWYERGLEYGNPSYESRFRVNSPEVMLHPEFGKRIEARENGLMLIRAEEDLSLLTGAELYLEMWGGHPGTANKRVTVNGRGSYYLPRVGTEEMNCTYQPGRQVTLYASHDLPRPFWSRANQKRECTIYLDVNPALIESAELHVNAWTGGPRAVKDYFKLNGTPFPVAESSRHELIYSRLPVDPRILRQGRNRIELLSDTEHHGIEILLPGPCLMVRSKTE